MYGCSFGFGVLLAMCGQFGGFLGLGCVFDVVIVRLVGPGVGAWFDFLGVWAVRSWC